MVYYIRIKIRTRIRDNKYINRRGEKMLFKNAEQVTPCGMFSLGHLILFTITMISVVIALKKTKAAQFHLTACCQTEFAQQFPQFYHVL